MNIITLLLLIVVVVIMTLVTRRLIRIIRRPGFPVFSIVILSISVVLLTTGAIMYLFSDAIGGALSTSGGFLGLLEGRVRHKREAAE